MVETIISFIVSVPVLSVLIALVAPSVSTSVRFLTTACASASCLAPSDSRPETNAGMPVGIAEIAIAVPSSSRSLEVAGRGARPTTTMKATAVHAMMPSTFVSESSSFCSGDRVPRRPRSASSRSGPSRCPCRSPSRPSRRCPRVTDGVLEQHVRPVAERDVVARRARRRPSATGALSPVSAASCVSSVAERMIRPSAGTMSPASTCNDVAGHDVARRAPARRARRARPGSGGPASSTARRRSPAP